MEWTVREAAALILSNKNVSPHLSPSAFIGPPDVTLHVTGTSLEVSIKDPVFKHSELRETYTSATYNITYWKSSSKEEVGTPVCSFSF